MSLVADTKDAGRIVALIEPTITSLGYELVRVAMRVGDTPTLQVMVECTDGRNVDLEDCATVSQALSVLLDVKGPISGSYHLEVSSPGVDRPLTRLEDFERFAGCEVKLELEVMQDGRRRFRGRLLGLDSVIVRMNCEGRVVNLPFDAIRKAQLVMTDDLLATPRELRRRN